MLSSDALVRRDLLATAEVGVQFHASLEMVQEVMFHRLRRGAARQDAVHAASALEAGFTEIVSADRDFDGVGGLRCLTPEQASSRAHGGTSAPTPS